MKNQITIVIALILALTCFSQEIPTLDVNDEDIMIESTDIDNFNEFSNNRIATAETIIVNETFTALKDIVFNKDALLLYSKSGELISYDLETNEQNWSFNSDNNNTYGSCDNQFFVNRGVVYIPFANGQIFALDGVNGKKIWQSKIGIGQKKRMISGQKVKIFNNKIFISSLNKNIYALSSKDGSLQWNYQLEFEYNIIPNTMLKNYVLVPNAGYLYNFNADTGKALFQRGFKLPLYSIPTINKNSLFIADTGGNLSSFKPDDLSVNWSFKLKDDQGGIKSKIKVLEDIVFVGSHKGKSFSSVYALNSSNGTELWRKDFKDEDIDDIEILSNNVYGYTKSGILFELDHKTGKKIFEMELKYFPISNLIKKTDRELLYHSKEGIIKIDLKAKKAKIIIKDINSIKTARGKSYMEIVKKNY
ncbi:outer membrane protein assembly factor BamB family protein [Aquimarina algicola]|uniref:PQQ-like beta-propeller repeat protein n=1 Tax=Aquimarina algicola TaxID=2589995 RepID=A0A504JCJ2_9FLAO|nr:PQQ-binding-like beta-propeller repeat protein [Aquimarina algicola]TPN86322.1 PQQ-like beta-propeller repeat protein [Aquimarina algicola]